jgi:hypothetical protein
MVHGRIQLFIGGVTHPVFASLDHPLYFVKKDFKIKKFFTLFAQQRGSTSAARRGELNYRSSYQISGSGHEL